MGSMNGFAIKTIIEPSEKIILFIESIIF